MKITAALTLTLALGTAAQAAPLTAFSEDFEATLAAWTDRTPANPQSVIVADPLRTGNHVLAFSRLGSGGSLFTTALITAVAQFTVSFDYLGLAGRGGRVGDIGGYFGIDTGFPALEYWVAGTGSYPTPIALIDDSQWHSYSLTFNSPVGQAVHLKFEDWDGSGGVAGDAYFDNVRFNDASVTPAPLPHATPEPSALALLSLALLAAGLVTRRRASQPG